MKTLSTLVIVACMAWTTGVPAADPPATERATEQTRERVYGYELMTPRERDEYHRRMRESKTEQEREALRQAHHERMQARAKAQGKSLLDAPPTGMGPGMMGPGMGPGSGMGHGMGPGSGTGPGGRR